MTAVLLDQGLPFSTARLLIEQGVDAIHVFELGMGESADEAILATARSQGRIVCTLGGGALVTVTAAGLRVRRLPVFSRQPG